MSGPHYLIGDANVENVCSWLFCSGSTIQNKQMFNIICELPETVARTLVPRIRVVKGSGKAINYLTPPRILLALVTAWLRRGRWFDDQVMLVPFSNIPGQFHHFVPTSARSSLK